MTVPGGQRTALTDRTWELVSQGWRVDQVDAVAVQLSRPSYWLPVWATVLLILGTCGAWIIPAALLQGSKRRDLLFVQADPPGETRERKTRGW